MAENISRKFKWIRGWQDDKEESWLRGMSLKGYHLLSYSFAGIYTFRKGEPHDYVYQLDYQPNSKKAESDYLQLFQDAGWEQVAEFLSWHYFRKEPNPGEATEVFTDAETRIAKYKRLLSVVLAAGVPSSVVLLAIPVWDKNSPSWSIVFTVLGLLFVGFYVYASLKINKKIKQLRAL